MHVFSLVTAATCIINFGYENFMAVVGEMHSFQVNWLEYHWKMSENVIFIFLVLKRDIIFLNIMSNQFNGVFSPLAMLSL